MKKTQVRWLSLVLVMAMLVPMLASCVNNVQGGETQSSTTNSTESETVIQSGESESKPGVSETQPGGSETQPGVSETQPGGSETQPAGDETKPVESETKPEDSKVEYPVADGDNGEVIANANNLWAGVNGYYENGTRKDYTIENQKTSLTIHAAPDGKTMVGSIKNSNGVPYVENTMDVFVTMENGRTYYSSQSINSITFDLYRFGMYYYELRAQNQMFVNKINEQGSLNLDVENNAPRSYYEMSAPTLNPATGAIKTIMEDKNDPRIYYSHAPFMAEDYNYIAIDVKADSPDMSYMRHLTIFVFKKDADGKSVVASESSLYIANDGEFHTYYFKLDNSAAYSGEIYEFRFDFSGIIGDSFEYKNVRAVKGDADGAPDLRLCRYLHFYSDKSQQVIQVTARTNTTGISEIGVITNIDASRVKAVIVKDKNGVHDSIANVDWDSAEYVAFDIEDAGIFGYILLPDGDLALMGTTRANDTSSGKIVVTEKDGKYVIVQSRAPKDGKLTVPTGTNNAEIDDYVENFDNCADFYMGHRLYTDDTHDFAEFIKAAETERHPLKAENIIVDTANSTGAEYLGYDAIRGMYVFKVDGSNFNRPYYEEPNKHFNVKFTVTGDSYERNMYIMTTTTHGELQSAVILDANDLLLPIPVEVGKNFSDSGQDYFDSKDEPWSEAYFPMAIKPGEEKTFNFLNIYMNWGRFPLKQISYIQLAPLYHLSTGVTETNCLLPWYSNMGGVRNIWTIPDHRPMSAPFWTTQPNHTSGGDHRFLRYTDSNGVYSATEVKRNYITSYGPTYAEVVFEHLSDDGKIKVKYTHMEMPQTDENRAYYTMEYEVLEDVSFNDFKNDFYFYSMNAYNGVEYEKVGYLDKNNECKTKKANTSSRATFITLGDYHPYFSFYRDDDCKLERGYINLSFLVKDAEFNLQSLSATPRLAIKEADRHIYLTLDLGEVTLKKGDTIKINAIIMPWGSQESDYSLEDKNVRDVRENTIINALTVVPDQGCAVVENEWIPEVKLTNGKLGGFIVKGASGNSTIKVSGVKLLCVPMLSEEVIDENGVKFWKRCNISSQYYPDKRGYGHSYDGYGVQYNEDGTYTYSFVVDMSEGKDRKFKIQFSENFVEEPQPEYDPSDNDYGEAGIVEGPNHMMDAEMLYNASNKTSASKAMDKTKSKVMKDSDGTQYFRFYAVNGSNEAWIMPYTIPSTPLKTGRYLTIKYRLPSTNYTSTTEQDGSRTTRFEIWTSTQSAVPSGNCLNYYKDYISADDQWHVLVIDLAQMKNLTFTPAPNGDYYANYLRFDMFAEGYGDNSYIDIAYISFDDRAEDIFAYPQNAGLDKVTYYDGRILDVLTSETEFPAPKQVYEEDTTEYETPFNVYISAGQLAHLGSNTNEFGNVTLYAEEGYVRFNSHALNKESDFAILRNTEGKETGRYLIIKYRASETLKSYIQFYATTEAGKTSFKDDNGATSLSNSNFVRDGKWQIAIIDLSTLTKEFTEVDGKFYATLVRLDVFNDVIGTTSEYVDIAFVAMCDDLKTAITYDKTVISALAIESKTSIRRYNTQTGEIFSGADVPAVPGEDVIVSVTLEQIAEAAGKGTNIGGAELSADGKYVTISNKVGSGNGFFFVLDGGANGINAGQYVMVKYRTTSADKWLWYVKTAGMSYGYIQVNPIADGEWHVIVIDLSKSPDGTYVVNGSGDYRASAVRWDVMTVASDSEKSVDVEFIAMGNNIDKLAESQNVEEYVNYDRYDGRVAAVDPENHTHIWTDATCDSPKACVLCDATDGEKLGHQWGEADENGNKPCTRCDKINYGPHDHVIVEDYVDDGNKKIAIGTCSICSEEFYRNEFTFGSTKPLQFRAPGQIATAAGKGTNIGGAVLSKDGTYVTISNKVGSGNGFFFIADGNVNAGQYVIVKYRTTSADKWLWYVKTKDQAYGYFQVDPIADGEWHVIVIDLSKSPDGTYVINSDNQYRAAAIRWDIMSMASSSEKSVDVAFIATSDSIENLVAINNIESCVNYDRFNGRVASVDPENHAHIWVDATCDAPKACVLCGATEGEKLGHAWSEVNGIEICDRCGKENFVPVYFQIQFIGSESKAQLVNGKPTKFNDALTTGASEAGKGKIFFQGWGGILGEIANIQFRVLSNTDGSVMQDWKDLDQYKTYPIVADNTANLQAVKEKVDGATNAYSIRGWMDISAFYGQTVTIEIAFIIKDAPEGEEYLIFATETNCTNIESEASEPEETEPEETQPEETQPDVTEPEETPVYIFIDTFGGEIKGAVYKEVSKYSPETAIKTSTSSLGKLYVKGRAAIAGVATAFVYRLLDAEGNVIQEWKVLDQYNAYPVFNDISNTTATNGTYIELAQKEVHGVKNIYQFWGWFDITAFPGQNVTIECAYILDGVEGDDAYYTFMTVENIQNIESVPEETEPEETPVYIFIDTFGGDLKGTVHKEVLEYTPSTSIATSTSSKGKLYVKGRAAIAGVATAFVYRLLDAEGNVIQEWKALDQYSAYPVFNDVSATVASNGTYLELAQKEVRGVENIYQFWGWFDITAFPGQNVTIECAYILEGSGDYFTFMTVENVQNIESAS